MCTTYTYGKKVVGEYCIYIWAGTLREKNTQRNGRLIVELDKATT